MPPRANSRNSILDASEAIVRESGASHLTLDAAAARAGVSKGGLLYHFPSKEDLLKAMMQRQLERFEESRERLSRQFADRPNALLQAHVKAAVEDSADNQQLCSAMLAAVANQPELLEPARTFHSENLDLCRKSSLGLERAALLWLATDGLWFLEMLQVSPLTAAQRKKITAFMLKLAEEWS